MAAAGVPAAIPSLLIAMYPPIGYDGTLYHLVYAKLFAQSGRIVFADALRFPIFPQIAEMHFTAALLLFGERAMHLTGWLALPVTAMATMSPTCAARWPKRSPTRQSGS